MPPRSGATGTRRTPGTCRGAPPTGRPWGVLVSEVMLAADAGRAGSSRSGATGWTGWPTPAGPGSRAAGEAVRAWGRLGYPRRALRLHAAARASSTGTAARSRGRTDEALRAPGGRRVHRRRHGVASPSATDRRRSTPMFAGSSARPCRPARPAPAIDHRAERASARGRSMLPDDGQARPLVRRRDGARCAGLHRPVAYVRCLPHRWLVRLAAGRFPAVRRTSPAEPAMGGHRPSGSGSA